MLGALLTIFIFQMKETQAHAQYHAKVVWRKWQSWLEGLRLAAGLRGTLLTL